MWGRSTKNGPYLELFASVWPGSFMDWQPLSVFFKIWLYGFNTSPPMTGFWLKNSQKPPKGSKTHQKGLKLSSKRCQNEPQNDAKTMPKWPRVDPEMVQSYIKNDLFFVRFRSVFGRQKPYMALAASPEGTWKGSNSLFGHLMHCIASLSPGLW